jgi:glycolate oxidase iron-sulfur subunit
VCCGSAGTYNLEQPEIAARLGERKARAVIASGAAAVATGNIGCAVQLRRHLRLLGSTVPVLHTVEILDRAYRGEATSPS